MDALLKQKSQQLQSVNTIITDKSGKKYILLPNGEKQFLDSSSSGFVVDNKPDPQLAYVMDGLYVGSQDAAGNLEGLKENNISHILNLVDGINPIYPDIFTYKTITLLDIEEEALNKDVLQACFDFINLARKNGTSCLVHCNAGVSRSVSICIAYKMIHDSSKPKFEDVFNELKKIRPAVRPNDGFKKQLLQLHSIYK